MAADDDTDPGGPPPVMLDLEPAEQPDPDMIPGAEEVTRAVEEGATEGSQRNNQNWFGGVITVIILVGLFVGFRAIMQGSLSMMVASAIIVIVIPVGSFVGLIGWRSGSATKDNNTNKKGEK